MFGIPAGVGAFTFVYAKGFSYLSTDPRACVNCHVMNPQYDAWLKSGHRHTATCVECHLPHGGIAKWAAKAEHGFRHSAAFTLQNFKEPIEITPRDHVEYYFKGPGKVVTYPWANGLKVEEIEAYYEREGFTDWVHAETGNKVLKAQHPEFEVWSQGVHAHAGWPARTATCPTSASAR